MKRTRRISAVSALALAALVTGTGTGFAATTTPSAIPVATHAFDGARPQRGKHPLVVLSPAYEDPRVTLTSLATAELDPPKVLVLTTFDDDEYVYGALRAGASGFLLKSMALDTILDAIRVVAAGDALIAPSVTRRLIADFAGTSTTPAAPAPDTEPAADSSLIARITDREREEPALVGQGLPNGEIAERLVISVATAKTHVARLFAKLKARDRVHLAITAFEAGLALGGR
ncbi:LuxR C-terminal-related transcriptional regulator [Streptomyces sp. 1331.2]|uniref:LuxR C-terminal-related transcriptional regulator n=1 Tax=Streptomyces sp. 1331.2 TaxID=1938835 RepID=UPI000BCE7F43|nr:response regulator transcription factor [Streptomyces sp. 1331.2]SOB85775.1 DNA-binding response regulator, NarL/FixJ family, contains REC and HTH domains [Streptomyces sp. 1331.2]